MVIPIRSHYIYHRRKKIRHTYMTINTQAVSRPHPVHYVIRNTLLWQVWSCSECSSCPSGPGGDLPSGLLAVQVPEWWRSCSSDCSQRHSQRAGAKWMSICHSQRSPIPAQPAQPAASWTQRHTWDKTQRREPCCPPECSSTLQHSLLII